MSTGEAWRLGRRPALDGLRGVAVLLVVVNHSALCFAVGAGTVGVTVFFTLSGFLISSILLEELERLGRVRLGAFYWRRCLRLVPALWALVAVVAMLGALGIGRPSALAPSLLYMQNWVLIHGETGSLLQHTWSLAIEEQFYLLYAPLLMLAHRLLSRRSLLGVMLAGAVASAVLRMLLWHDGNGALRIYYGFDTRADSMLVGCALAVVLHGSQVRRAPRFVVPASLGVIAALGVCEGFSKYVVVPTLVPLLTALVIAVVVSDGYCGRLQARWLMLVGQRSYGLYLWHGLVFVLLLPHFTGQPLLGVLIACALSWCLTLASWRFEERFTRRQGGRSPQSQPARGLGIGDDLELVTPVEPAVAVPDGRG